MKSAALAFIVKNLATIVSDAGWQVQLWGERGEFGERQVRRVGELSELGFAFAMGAAFALFVRRALALVI